VGIINQAFVFLRDNIASNKTEMQITPIANVCQPVIDWFRKSIANNAAITGLKKNR